MHIQVKGKQIDVGTALTEHVETQLAATVGKYFDRPTDATVTFSRDAWAYRCDCNVHLPTGLMVQSSASEQDVYATFDRSIERIEKQLRRYKRRLRDHHKDRKSPVDLLPAQSFVLDAADFEDEADEPDSLKPVIVAETKETVPSLSVGEAVMQMELADRQFLLFRHEKTGRVNLVHRRDDGNVGWVDPSSPDAS